MRRSVIRSLPATAAVTFTFLVTAATASAEFYPLTNPCPPAPIAGTGTCQPAGITTGPDGNIWFTEENGNRIGRITPSGQITEFDLPGGSLPAEITPGPDGALWFTQSGSNSIGRITTSGTISPPRPVSGSPDGIVAGPDGNIWFTEPLSHRIGRLATGGGSPTYFGSSATLNEPGDLTVGPDQRLWFTQGAGGRIGAITTGASPVLSPNLVSGLADPSGITSSSGALWFTENNNGVAPGQVRSVSTSGTLGASTQVGAGPSAIATGADGALWFTETSAGKIGRITPSGVLTNEFPASSPGAQPGGITAGPDGALWYTEFAGNGIGRIATAPPFVPPPPPGGSTPPPAAKKKSKKCKVPRLRGLTVKKARSKLRKARCKYKIRGKGRVRSTSPKAGRTTTKRVTVRCGKSRRR